MTSLSGLEFGGHGDRDFAWRFDTPSSADAVSRKVTPEELLDGTTDTDLETIAEGYGVPDVVVADALGQLRIENTRASGFVCYRLGYRPEGKRQIDIERWPTPDKVRANVTEVLEDLESTGNPLLERIRSHLSETVDIVDVSFGASPGEQMAPVLASEAVRWLAEKFDGIIRDDGDAWWQLGSRLHEVPKTEAVTAEMMTPSFSRICE